MNKHIEATIQLIDEALAENLVYPCQRCNQKEAEFYLLVNDEAYCNSCTDTMNRAFNK